MCYITTVPKSPDCTPVPRLLFLQNFLPYCRKISRPNISRISRLTPAKKNEIRGMKISWMVSFFPKVSLFWCSFCSCFWNFWISRDENFADDRGFSNKFRENVQNSRNPRHFWARTFTTIRYLQTCTSPTAPAVSSTSHFLYITNRNEQILKRILCSFAMF